MSAAAASRETEKAEDSLRKPRRVPPVAAARTPAVMIRFATARRGLDLRKRIAPHKAAVISTNVPIPPAMAANRRGPNPASAMVAKMSEGIPPSGRDRANGVTLTRVVAIAENPKRPITMMCPTRRPTERNTDPTARNGILRTAPNKKKVR